MATLKAGRHPGIEKHFPISITDQSKPMGFIRFIHSDGKEHTFRSAVNDATGDRLSWWNSNAPDIGDTVAWVRSVFRDIRAKAKVLEVIGDF